MIMFLKCGKISKVIIVVKVYIDIVKVKGDGCMYFYIVVKKKIIMWFIIRIVR